MSQDFAKEDILEILHITISPDGISAANRN
jgi:hypothetical protein